MPAPTGIDRVERAYVRWVLGRRGHFVAGVDGRQYLVDREAVARLVAWLDGGDDDPPLDLIARLRPDRNRRLRRAQSLVRRRGVPLPDLPGGVYINVGHDNLAAPLLGRLRGMGFRTVAMIHDTIPVDHPEFARLGSPARFQALLREVAGVDAVLTNSQDTAVRLYRHLAHPRIVPAPLGIDPVTVPATRPDERGFLCLGTIEPRKNHAMLLDIWADLGPDAPQLRIAGRRGWSNEEVFRRLDSDPMMGRNVHEIGTPDDAGLAAEIAGARALLFPSLAEGYGLPLGEALARGTPVIASDLPALREVGGTVQEWLPPSDAPAWRDAILAYDARPSARRKAQIARMADWQPPTWEDHFAIVEQVIDGVRTG